MKMNDKHHTKVRMISLGVLLLILTTNQQATCQIYRWDNGELIPGSEGIDLSQGGDFSGIDLPYADLSRMWIGLRGVNLSDSNLNSSDLSESIVEASLERANLTHANLTGASLVGKIVGAELTNTDIRWAEFRSQDGPTAEQIYETASYQNKDLMGVRFWHTQPLSGWDFSGIRLDDSLFNNVDLTEANFAGATIQGAAFSVDGLHVGRTPSISAEQLYTTASYQEQNLRGITFQNLDLSNWDLHGQDLSNSSWSGVNVTETNFDGAIIADAEFGDTSLSLDQLYSTASYRTKDLRNITTGSLDLSNADLSNQDLRGARLGFPKWGAAAWRWRAFNQHRYLGCHHPRSDPWGRIVSSSTAINGKLPDKRSS